MGLAQGNAAPSCQRSAKKRENCCMQREHPARWVQTVLEEKLSLVATGEEMGPVLLQQRHLHGFPSGSLAPS